MFAQDKLRLVNADILWTHDLIGRLVLQHPILMNTGFMSECIRADDRFVGLDDDARVVANEFADSGNLWSFDTGLQIENRSASLQRHDHLFEGGVSGTLTDPINGNFRLSSARPDSCQGVRGRHPQIIMAMDRDRDAIMHAWRIFDDAVDQRVKFIWCSVSDRI